MSPASVRMSAAARLSLVQFIAEKLADSRDLPEVLEAVVSGMKEALGAAAINVGTVSGDALVTLVSVGFEERSAELLSKPVLLGEGVPAATVLRTGEPLFWSSLDERNKAYPEFAHFPSEKQSWAILPLVVHGSSIGVMSLGWGERRRFSRADAALLEVIAHQCAVAVDRARLQEVERAEREILELLGEGTRLMVSALDPDHVLQRLVRLAVPRLAPWCAVYVAEKHNLERVAMEVAGASAIAEEMRRAPAVAFDSDTAIATTYRTGQTMVLGGLSADSVRGRPPAGDAPRALPDTTWTAMVVPVKAAGRVIGVMSLASDAWEGTPPVQIRYAAEGLAGRAGVALSNARRYERERLTASLLTQALLPAEIQRIPGYETTARYLPAGSQVAGDWFDLAHLPSGQFLVGVGDAAGHGIHAASLMAQLRSAARGLAVGGNPPSEILHGLGLLTLEDDPESFATAVYALLDAEDGSVLWASAGHIPPLVWSKGAADYLEGVAGTPLGWPSATSPTNQVARLQPGDALVLVTDGVVERRGTDLAERLGSLRSVVAGRGHEGADRIADHVVDELCVEPQDDCCVVVLKRR